MPLIVFIRNRLKYALNGRETKAIVMQRLIKVDGKVRNRFWTFENSKRSN